MNRIPDAIPFVVVSTRQEIVNLITIVNGRRLLKWEKRHIQPHILLTEEAERQGWADRLDRALQGRDYLPARKISFADLGVANEYDSAEIADALAREYEGDEVVLWGYSGGQKAQAIGLYVAFARRLHAQRESGTQETVDQAFCLDEGKGTVHAIIQGDQDKPKPIDIDLRLEEFAVLFGKADVQVPKGILLCDQGKASDPDPLLQNAEKLWRMDARHLLDRFAADQEVRLRMFSLEKPPKKGSDRAARMFEAIVALRVHRFLRKRKGDIRVYEGRSNCIVAGSSEVDVLLSLRSGRLVSLDAKLGGGGAAQDRKYRKQLRGVQELGGSAARLYYVLLWFPKHLNPKHFDFEMKPNGRTCSMIEGAHAHRKDIPQSALDGWRKTDEDFGQGWSDPKGWPQGGPPPDDPNNPLDFHRSLIIPYDAGTLFEQRLEKILL